MELLTTSVERKIKSAIPNNLKKLLIFLLTMSFWGKLIKISGIRNNLFGGIYDYSLVTDKQAARIFWGFWESAEIRFSKRFAKNKIIIELGSSIGVTLGVLSNILKDTTFICIEASLINFKKLQLLEEKLNKNNNYILVNKAIAYGVNKVDFITSENIIGSKINKTEKKSDTIGTTTLRKILKENNLNENFTLITDIEGAEADIFFKDGNSLSLCSQIIAELENTSSYSIEEQVTKLLSYGFKIKERYGNVFVFIK